MEETASKLELLRAQYMLKVHQAQSLERDVVVLEYKRLMEEAFAINTQITALEAGRQGGTHEVGKVK